MWLFTRHGFFSATMSPTKKGHMQLRARTQQDLRKLIVAFPDQLRQSRIIETPKADYRWRIVMTPSKWVVLAMKLAEDIDYGNFKNAAAANGIDTTPHHQVWSIMAREQWREEDRDRAAWRAGALPGLRDLAGPSLFDDDDPAAEDGSWEDPDGHQSAYGGERDADALARKPGSGSSME